MGLSFHLSTFSFCRLGEGHIPFQPHSLPFLSTHPCVPATQHFIVQQGGSSFPSFLSHIDPQTFPYLVFPQVQS